MKTKKIFSITLSVATYATSAARDVTFGRHTGLAYDGYNGSSNSHFCVTDASWRRAQRAQAALWKRAQAAHKSKWG